MFCKFQILKKALKRAKTLKNHKKTEKKKLQFFFCLGAFTREGKMSVIKKACFVLNFLNLKSFPSDLFFVVASSLSILWPSMFLVGLFYFRK
jgi:hypothetical protein